MRQSVKTIGLWVVLLVLFVAFYLLFSAPNASPAPAAEPAVSKGSGLSLWSLLPTAVVLLSFVVIFKRAQRQQRPAREGARLLARGRCVQALEHFEAYRKAEPDAPAAAFNVGWAKLQLWKLEAALTDLQAARTLGKGKLAGELAVYLPEYLALAQALLGRNDEVRPTLQQLSGAECSGSAHLTEAIVLLRSGDAAAARAKLDTLEVKHLSGTVGALARTLDAMCVEQLTGERRHVDRVALFGEASPDELRRAWPELVSFVERAPAW